MQKVLVIGGSGFVGSHIADELSSRGYEVTILDNTESPWLKENQNMIVDDVLDRNSIRQIIKDKEYVYHFAGIADIHEATKRPYEAIDLNVMGTTAVLDAVRDEGLKRFVYASTMYVYSPYGSFYRASKQAAETIIEAYHEAYGIPYTLLRYGSLYGPRAQSWNGLRGYIKEVVRNGRLEYDGNGSERREYIHVQDAARLSVDILDESHLNQAITVTGSQVLNSKEIIEMIFEIAGLEINVEYVEGKRHEYHYVMTPYRYTPKNAKKLVPREFVDLGQGILEIVEELNL